MVYPLVNIQKATENDNFSWENPLFLWPFSIAMLNYQRVIITLFGLVIVDIIYIYIKNDGRK